MSYVPPRRVVLPYQRAPPAMPAVAAAAAAAATVACGGGDSFEFLRW